MGGGVYRDVIRCCTVDATLTVVAHEVLLVDTVPECVGDAADDGASDLTGSHLTQLIARCVRVVGGMRCADEVRCFLEGACW